MNIQKLLNKFYSNYIINIIIGLFTTLYIITFYFLFIFIKKLHEICGLEFIVMEKIYNFFNFNILNKQESYTVIHF